MKNTYHISFTSHDEVMFRDREDHTMFVNMLALHSHKDDVGIVADAEMSNHVHLNAIANRPLSFAAKLKMSYYRWFNHKYSRSGPLGEPGTFILQLDGLYHKMVANSYILRNGLHHGAASNAFGYEFCSVRDVFTDEIGLSVSPPSIFSRRDIAYYLPKDAVFPDNWRMDKNGLILRRDFMELEIAESYYSTPRNYLYQMNRLTDKKLLEEQFKDNTGDPITLSDIEPVYTSSLSDLLNNESGRSFSKSKLQDLDVCHLIDNELLVPYGVSSVYLLNSTQRNDIAKFLRNEFYLPDKQIARCLPAIV